METLNQALNSVQEDLLSLYEQNSESITDQIQHWNLLRREQVILYYARERGITRLGMTLVPPRHVSQQKAKAAIEQVLYLTSLSQSSFKDERWTLGDTSRERFLTEPENCFKKGGQQIDVKYGGEEDNIVRYTLWANIYFQNEQDSWEKAEGKVDNKGLYYEDADGVRTYYVDFIKEATKYSSNGQYEVLQRVNPVSRPASGAVNSAPLGCASHCSTPKKKTADPPRRGNYRRRRSKPSKQGQHSPGGRQGKQASTSRPTAPSPGEVGRSHKSASPRLGGRLERLIQEARDPPIVVLKGEANPLKCLRYRLTKGYSSTFEEVSTTWKWASCKTKDPCGRARMLVSFSTPDQRDLFLQHVPLPKSVKYFLGSLNDI
ncbi:E2 [Enhydra lutris papillomavirus 1]|uniref:Regulatory protein E2 n=1 Tax=Enhydra lutris papillomavirus 1 TaxID=1472717 RepID=W8RHQ6_9PAPI|nr:E2 [Enhydra lutris papillomavirus 1]AHL83545.1 E2 [Enhydra lutris papillomavirus 1]